MRLSLALVAAALSAAAVVPSQNTIIVDAAGGGDYTDIPPAVAAAVDGDRILIRPGEYSVFTIDGKALSVFGTEGVRVRNTSTLGGVVVANLAAGRDLVVANLELSTLMGLGAELTVSQCAGRVLLDRLAVHSGFLRDASIRLEDCAHVLLQGCELQGPLDSKRSRAAITDCSVSGTSSVNAAMTAAQGTIEIAHSSFVAGNALLFPVPPGIRLDNASLRVRDDGTNVIAAGDSFSLSRDASAIDGTGTVEVGQGVVLRPSGAAPPISAALSSQIAFLPVLVARGARLGGIASVELTSHSVASYFLLWSNAGNATPFPPLGGDVWLDPGTATLARAGALDVRGRTRFDFRVPLLNALIGAPFHWQAVAETPVGLRLSNPSGYTHTE